LAPLMLREWKMLSGISGVRARDSQATNATRSASDIAPSVSAPVEPHPSSAADLTIV